MLEDGTLVLVSRLGAAFRRVYQGGHHDVYCDGERHATLYGGWVHGGTKFPAILKPNWTNGCDCAKYNEGIRE